MKQLFSTLFIVAFATLNAQVQVITAKEILEYANCKDTTCFVAFANSKKWQYVPELHGSDKESTICYYRINRLDCPATDGMPYSHIAQFFYHPVNKISALTFTTSCKDVYDTLLKEFAAEGFMHKPQALENSRPAPVKHYTSTVHPLLHMETEEFIEPKSQTYSITVTQH